MAVNQHTGAGAAPKIAPEDMLLHADKMPKHPNLYENHSHYLVGHDNGKDLLYQCGIYTVKGVDNWVYDDVRRLQMVYFAVPAENRGHMTDNPFVCTGWVPYQFYSPEDLKVGLQGDRAVWTLDGMRFEDHPPYWELKGSHLGVEVDLTMESTADPWWYFGQWSKFAEVGHAGFDQVHRIARGTVSYRGDTFDLTKLGWGCHEHLGMTDVLDRQGRFKHVRSEFKPYIWMWGHSDDLQFYVFQHPLLPSYGRVRRDKDVMVFGDQDVLVDQVDYWIDPRSNVRVPCKWHVNMASDRGVVDFNMATHGRAYMVYLQRKALLFRYWSMGTANGRLIYPNGEKKNLDNLLVFNDLTTTFLKFSL